MTGFIASLISGAILIALSAPAALACSCACPTKLTRAQLTSEVKDRLEGVVYAFEGRVVSSSSHDGPDNSRYTIVTFAPDRIVKGRPAQLIKVAYVSASITTSCDLRLKDENFAPGTPMKVFAVNKETLANSRNQSALSRFRDDTLFAQTRSCDCFGEAVFDRSGIRITPFQTYRNAPFKTQRSQ